MTSPDLQGPFLNRVECGGGWIPQCGAEGSGFDSEFNEETF